MWETLVHLVIILFFYFDISVSYPVSCELIYIDLIATLESNQTIVYLELTDNSGIDPALVDEVQSVLKTREITYFVDLMERVKQNDPSLTTLNLSRMNIGLREDVLHMLDSLTNSIYVRKVDLSLNAMDDDCVSYISLALEDNISVTHLNLSNNVIQSDGAECKCAVLQ